MEVCLQWLQFCNFYHNFNYSVSNLSRIVQGFPYKQEEKEEDEEEKKRTRNAIENVGSGFALGETVEETAEPLPVLLDDLHPLLNLEVPKVLLPNPTLLAHADHAPLREGPPDLPEGGARALVRRHVEVDAPRVGATAAGGGGGGVGDDVAEAGASETRLGEAVVGQGDPVVGGGGVGGAVEVALTLAVAHQDYPLRKDCPVRLVRRHCLFEQLKDLSGCCFVWTATI